MLTRAARKPILLSAFSLLLVAGALLSGCSNGSYSSQPTSPTPVTSTTGHATVVLSDPATCVAPTGPFAHVYVTITDVKASVKDTAGDGDPSFVDLTPNLPANPRQIDLLGQADNQCFLATLGDVLQLQPGKYQQIRIFLADNSATIAGNACSGSTSCVVLNTGGVFPLQLSSESKTGIKIPVGQIASGGFNIAAGETKDLDIDFNTCTSIVRQGNGKYRLKPVLHAGEVNTTATSINGTVVSSANGNPVSGPVLVALEQKDAAGIDRIFMSTLTDSKGAFVFCPLPSGSYDVVVAAAPSGTVGYAPSVITGVATGTALSLIKVYPAPASLLGTALLQGQVTATAPGGAASVDVLVSVLSQLPGGLTFTVPLLQNALQSSDSLALSTEPGSSCPQATDCASYSLAVPSAAASSGAFQAGGTTLTPNLTPVSYQVDGQAFAASSGGTPICTPAELKTSPFTPLLTQPTAVATLTFAGCQ